MVKDFNKSGVGPRHLFSLKSSQVILIYTKVGEPCGPKSRTHLYFFRLCFFEIPYATICHLLYERNTTFYLDFIL
ncbi:unnamed protein product [Gulo gulo]|uniref:Uncharacterized protein n=1 Tax=Gulo gulo TaxID=48420 RepID=A0A9X9LF90_GULGU|nr:unnamed protein product [Gulo gulo]